MSTTVAVGDFQVSSTDETAEQMVEALTPHEDDKPTPHVVMDKGQPVEEKPKDGLSKAASDLGKAGAKAAAKARKEQAKAAPAEEEGEAEEQDGQEAAPETPKDRRGDPRFDPKARIAESRREAREAKERADRVEQEARELRTRLERLEREKQAPAQPQPAQERRSAPAADDAPREEDFESYPEFVRATARYEYAKAAEKAQREAHAHRAASEHVQRINSVVDGYRGAISKATDEDPDFADYVRPITDRLVPSFTLPADEPRNGWNWLADDLISSGESAPALLRYLAEHDDDLQRIAALSMPRAVTRELAKIETRLAAATTGTHAEREVSKAPPPVTPVTGSPTVASGQKYREGMSLDDYAKGWKPSPRR